MQYESDSSIKATHFAQVLFVAFSVKGPQLCFSGLKIQTGEHLCPSIRQEVTAPAFDCPAKGQLILFPAVDPTQCLGWFWLWWIRRDSSNWGSSETWSCNLLCKGIWVDRQAGDWNVLPLLHVPFHTPAIHYEGYTPRGPRVPGTWEPHRVDMNPFHSVKPDPVWISWPPVYRKSCEWL